MQLAHTGTRGHTSHEQQATGSTLLSGSQFSAGLAGAFGLIVEQPPCCDVGLSVRFVTMTLMSELPAGDTHDVISHSGQVVAVVVPIEEYRQLRQAMQEQQVNEEFDAARARYLARREARATTSGGFAANSNVV